MTLFSSVESAVKFAALFLVLGPLLYYFTTTKIIEFKNNTTINHLKFWAIVVSMDLLLALFLRYLQPNYPEFFESVHYYRVSVSPAFCVFLAAHVFVAMYVFSEGFLDALFAFLVHFIFVGLIVSVVLIASLGVGIHDYFSRV